MAKRTRYGSVPAATTTCMLVHQEEGLCAVMVIVMQTGWGLPFPNSTPKQILSPLLISTSIERGSRWVSSWWWWWCTVAVTLRFFRAVRIPSYFILLTSSPLSFSQTLLSSSSYYLLALLLFPSLLLFLLLTHSSPHTQRLSILWRGRRRPTYSSPIGKIYISRYTLPVIVDLALKVSDLDFLEYPDVTFPAQW